LEPRVLLSATLLSEDFEGAFPGAWSVNSSFGRTWDETQHLAHAGAASAHCSETAAGAETNNYVNYQTTTMQRTVNLLDYSSATLGFWYWMNSEAGKDFLRVKVNGSTVWQQSGSHQAWMYQALDLSSYAGRSSVTVRFEFLANGSVVPVGDAGVWIDDVLLVGEPIPEWPDAPFAGAAYEQALYTNQFGDAAVTGKYLSPARDFDGYLLTFNQAGEAAFETTGWTDTKLGFYDGPGQPDATADTGASGANARLARAVPAGQGVWVGVRGGTSATAGGYGLTVNGPSAAVSVLAIDPELNFGRADAAVAGEGDVLFYQFTLPVSGTWRLTLSPGGPWDPTLNVFDAAGRAVGGSFTRPINSRGAGAAETWTGYGLRAGAAYWVRVDGLGPSAGDFTLAVQGPAVPDPDDQVREAHAVTVGSTVTGYQVLPGDDVDMFAFTVAAGARVGLDVDLPPGSGLDPYLRLFNSRGSQLAANNNAAGPAPEASAAESSIAYTFPSAGTYYVAVSGNPNTRYSAAGGYGDSAGSTGAYTLILTDLALDPDPDDQTSEAAPLAVGDAVAGTIDSATDVDLYAIAVDAGRRLGFDVDCPSGALDSWLRLFDAGGTPLAWNDDASGPAPEYSGVESYLTYTFADAGTYYLGVSGYPNDGYNAVTGAGDVSGGTGAYALAVLDLPPPGPGEFNVEMNLSGLTASQAAIFAQAAARWEAIIIADIPDALYHGQPVDDVLIDASAVSIDGPGGILGQAGPTDFRGGSHLPIRGIMQFDTADMANMETGGYLDEVVIHEMAHILGFGTIWTSLGLVAGYYTSDPRFTGPQALAEYNAIFGVTGTGVPVEAGGGAGTARSHWRESAFNNELMTGWIDPGYNPLSRITIASMADLGYMVDLTQADPYVPPVRAA
jgi:hypothetical protein